MSAPMAVWLQRGKRTAEQTNAPLTMVGPDRVAMSGRKAGRLSPSGVIEKYDHASASKSSLLVWFVTRSMA